MIFLVLALRLLKENGVEEVMREKQKDPSKLVFTTESEKSRGKLRFSKIRKKILQKEVAHRMGDLLNALSNLNQLVSYQTPVNTQL